MVVVGDCAGGGGAAEEPGSSMPVVGIDGTDRLPGSGWRVHNQVSMPRNLRFRSHDTQFPPIDARHPFRFLSGEGLLRPTVSSNCTQLYILLTFRTFQVSNIRMALKVALKNCRASNRLVLEIIIIIVISLFRSV